MVASASQPHTGHAVRIPHPDLAPSARLVRAYRAQLAQAVAASEPHAGLIPPDNKQFWYWAPIDEAVEQDECFAVKVKGDILALDCNEPSRVETVWKIRDTCWPSSA